MFASHESFNGNLDVPVVRRYDRNNVDVVPFENLAVIFVGIRFNNLSVGVSFANAGIDGSGKTVVFVNVAKGDNIDQTVESVGVASTHAADADAAHAKAVAGSLRPNRFRGCNYRNRRCHRGCGGRRLKEISTGYLFHVVIS